MGQLGFGELLLIALVVMLLFGAKRLPEVGKSLGEAIREFQKAVKGGRDDDKHDAPKQP